MTKSPSSQRLKGAASARYRFLFVGFGLFLMAITLVFWAAVVKVEGRRATLRDQIDQQKLKVSQLTQSGRIIADLVFGEVRQALKSVNLPPGEGVGSVRQEKDYYEYTYSHPGGTKAGGLQITGNLMGQVPAKTDPQLQRLQKVMQHLYERDLTILGHKWSSRVAYTYWMSKDQTYCFSVPRWDFQAAIAGSPEKTASSAMAELANAMLTPFASQIQSGQEQIFRTDAWIDSTDGRALQTMVSPMFDAAGAWIGNAAVDFSLSEIDQVLGESDIEQAQWLLVTSRSTVLARHVDRQGVLEPLVWGKALSDAAIPLPPPKDGFESVARGYRVHIVAVPGSNLHLYLLTPANWIYQDLSAILVIGGGGLLLLAFGFGVVWRTQLRRERETQGAIDKAEAELKAYNAQLEADSATKSFLGDVSAALHQATSLATFALTFMRSVMPRVAVEYGAFYVLDDDSGRLNPVGGYGVRPEDLDAVAVGQGLVGQCAKSMIAIHIPDPPGTDIRIIWGQGAARPKAILMLPVVQSADLLGVVVLAALGVIEADKRALLDALLPMVAMNLEILKRNLGTQRQAEALQRQQAYLQETEAWYRGIIESAPDGMLVADEAGVIILANPQIDAMFGYEAGALVGRSIEDLVPAAARSHHVGLRDGYTRGGTARTMGALNKELRGVRRDGVEFPVEVGLSRLPALGARGLCVCASVRDITPRKQNEAALAALEERSRLILTAVGDGIVGMDTEGRITFVNPAVPALLGYDEDELIGKAMHPLVHHSYPDGREFPRTECPMYMTFCDGEARKVDSEVLWRKDGTPIPVEYSTTPVIKDGVIVGSVITFRDIRERKAAAEALVAERERLQNILDRAPIGITFTTNGQIRFANPLFIETFGAGPGDMVPQLYVNTEDRDRLLACLQREGVILNGEVKVYDRHKCVRDMLITYLPIRFDDEDGILAWVLDITELKAAEVSVRKSMETAKAGYVTESQG